MARLKDKMDRLTEIIFGSDDVFALEHQCFNGICFLLTALFFLSAVINYYIGLPVEMILGGFVAGILFGLFFYLSRYRQLFYPLYWIVFAAGCLFVNLVWFYSAGISGTATIISLNIVAVVSLILDGWRRWLSVLLICANLGALYLIEYFMPGLVEAYTSPLARFMDLFFTFSIATLIISFVIHFTVRHFRQERQKVRDREEKLKAIINNIPDSVWLKDRDACFTMVNKPFSDNCRVPVKQIIGAGVFDIWPQDMAKRFETADGTQILPEYASSDGIHLNRKGKRIYADIVEERIAA